MTQHDARRFRPQRVILVLAGVVALGAVGWSLASRDRADPMATPSAEAASGSIVDQLQDETRANPDDARSWRNLGFALYEEQRYDEAVKAYKRAAELEPTSAVTWSALGEARVMASKRDPLPADAVAAFEKSVSLDPKDPRARYFLAVRKDLAGDHQGAIDAWLALLADTPANAPWHDDLVRTIEQVGKINKIATDAAVKTAQASAPASSPAPTQMPFAAQGIPGPSAQDLEAASSMRPSEQTAMAQGMVARLEGKLKTDPGNVDGWVMLMRSRVTLGEPDKARKALADAVAANPARADYLRQQAQVLGIR